MSRANGSVRLQPSQWIACSHSASSSHPSTTISARTHAAAAYRAKRTPNREECDSKPPVRRVSAGAACISKGPPCGVETWSVPEAERKTPARASAYVGEDAVELVQRVIADHERPLTRRRVLDRDFRAELLAQVALELANVRI